MQAFGVEVSVGQTERPVNYKKQDAWDNDGPFGWHLDWLGHINEPIANVDPRAEGS